MMLFFIIKQFINKHICVSENVYKSWKIKKSEIIENGIQIHSNSYLLEIKNKPKIGYVGNFSPSKGQDEFLEILIKFLMVI